MISCNLIILIFLHNHHFLKYLFFTAIQLATAATQDSGIQGLQTLTMANTGGGTAASAIVQYTQGQDGQFFVPGKEIILFYR